MNSANTREQISLIRGEVFLVQWSRQRVEIVFRALTRRAGSSFRKYQRKKARRPMRNRIVPAT